MVLLHDAIVRQRGHHVFGNGFTLSFGTDTQFSSASAVIQLNGPNGVPYGPGFGVQTKDFSTFSPVYANYQGGFFNTQPVNFESNLQKTVVQREQKIRQENAENKSFENSWSETINNTANILGPVDFSYNMWLDATSKASGGAKGVGTGLTGLSTILGGLQVYNQYTKGGIKNVDPLDGISVVAGTTGIWAKVMSGIGFGGEFTSLIGDVAGKVAYPVAIFQLWYNVYKPMDNLRFAPSYFDPNGEPVYGNPTEDDLH